MMQDQDISSSYETLDLESVEIETTELTSWTNH